MIAIPDTPTSDDDNPEQPEGEKEIDVEEIIDEDDLQEPDQEEPSGDGFATGVNKAFGRVFTLDLDPDKEDASRLRKQLQGLAEDVRLGHNTARFARTYVFTDDEPDPKTALLGSTVAACGMAIAIRPELIQKLRQKINQNEVNDDEPEDAAG